MAKRTGGTRRPGNIAVTWCWQSSQDPRRRHADPLQDHLEGLGIGRDLQGSGRVDIAPGHAINSFDPDSALGISIDVLSRTGIDKVYTPHIVQEALSAGWGPITYRNNTELRMAAWHWTENGARKPARADIFTGSRV